MAQICVAIRGGCPTKVITLFRHVSLVKKHTGTKICASRVQGASVALAKSPSHDLHVTTRTLYPSTKHLPLPHNVDDIDANEVSRFSPQRDRDISGSVILTKTYEAFSNGDGKNYKRESYPVDPHVASYDCRGALSLNSVMQSNVPEPYSTNGKSAHLNMPGGQWSQGQKYIAEDMQNSHYKMVPGKNSNGQGTSLSKSLDLLSKPVQFNKHYSILSSIPSDFINRSYCTSADNNKLSRKDKLKRAVKEYGTTVIVFHVGISLLSLGGCYLAVVSGVELGGVMQSLGPGSEVAAGAGQFVVAYAIHKVMAPIRISITLGSTPFIVRYLRSKGILKVPNA